MIKKLLFAFTLIGLFISPLSAQTVESIIPEQILLDIQATGWITDSTYLHNDGFVLGINFGWISDIKPIVPCWIFGGLSINSSNELNMVITSHSCYAGWLPRYGGEFGSEIIQIQLQVVVIGINENSTLQINKNSVVYIFNTRTGWLTLSENRRVHLSEVE